MGSGWGRNMVEEFSGNRDGMGRHGDEDGDGDGLRQGRVG